MAAVIGGMDELVREYLLYRGFSGTIKHLDNEMRNEKERAFRVDKLMEQFHSLIASSDLAGLREYWTLLDRRLFSRLDQVYAVSVSKLEVSLLKMFVVNAVQAGRHDKVLEFFEKMTPWEQGSPEWKDWFVLPFVKTAEEQPAFSMYFTKQWQDTLFLSLHNFLSVVIAAMPKPCLLRFEEDQRRICQLTKKNEQLTSQLRKVQPSASVASDGPLVSDGHSCPSTSCMDLMDDFFVISQDTTIEDKAPTPVGKTQQIRSFIRNIALPSSPIMGKRGQHGANSEDPSSKGASVASSNIEDKLLSSQMSGGSKQDQETVKKRASPAVSDQQKLLSTQPRPQCEQPRPSNEQPRPPPDQPHPQAEQSSTWTPGQLEASPSHPSGVVMRHSQSDVQAAEDSPSDTVHRPAGSAGTDDQIRSDFLLLSQEEYNEHRSSLSHCRFSSTAHSVATADVDGVVKIWNLQPSPVTIATTMSKSVLLSLEWVSNSERLILLGSKSGTVRLYDVKDKKTMKEVTTDSALPRIVTLACSPSGNSFVCSGAGRLRVSTGGSSEQSASRMGKLSLWDVKTMKLEKVLNFGSKSVAINSTDYNHNGSLIITGGADGALRLFDVSSGEAVSSWQAHSGEVYCVQFSPDETCCFSMGADGKFIQWSLHRPGQVVHDLPIHSGACGPFVLTGAGGYRQVQTPKGQLFAFDTDGKHVLTGGQSGGILYQLRGQQGLQPALELGGHRSPVVCVDWSTALDCKMCLTGSMEGQVKLSTLLQQ